MKLAEQVLEKLSPKKMQQHKTALKHATEMLGKAKVKLADAKKKGSDKDVIDDAQDNLSFWQERVSSITSKTKEA
jgi:hypothetical protein